jgi:large subunit ribosomal protein L3
LGFAERKKGTDKPHKGHFKKAGTPDLRFLREFAVEEGDPRKPGDVIKVDVLNGVGLVDVTGTTKGRGFAGCVRRHGFNRGPVTHGSKNIREPGSAGQKTFPARVFPGKRMPGQLGNQQRTIRSIRVFRVDPERDLLLLRGAVPGPIGGLLVIRQAIKERNK